MNIIYFYPYSQKRTKSNVCSSSNGKFPKSRLICINWCSNRFQFSNYFSAPDFLPEYLIRTPGLTVLFYTTFSTTLLLLGVPWIITAVGSMFLLTLFLKEKIGIMKQDGAQ